MRAGLIRRSGLIDGAAIVLFIENTLRIWDIDDKAVLRKVIPGRAREAQANPSPQGLSGARSAGKSRRPARVAWNPAPSPDDGILIATADQDRKIRIWAISDLRSDNDGQNVKKKDGGGGAQKGT